MEDNAKAEVSVYFTQDWVSTLYRSCHFSFQSSDVMFFWFLFETFMLIHHFGFSIWNSISVKI